MVENLEKEIEQFIRDSESVRDKELVKPIRTENLITPEKETMEIDVD